MELQDAYGLPSLSDVLARALAEVRQIGATGADFDEQVRAVRTAIFTHGCRTADEMVDETRLSRWAVDRVLRRLVDEGAVETRDAYLLEVDADEPGRPPIEYHPTDSPRGEVFTHILRRAVDDDLL
jgi:predicted ArsR family transcriptional regulator